MQSYAGDITVAMTYLMMDLQLVVLVHYTQSIEGDSWMSTSIAAMIGRGNSHAQLSYMEYQSRGGIGEHFWKNG